MKATKVRLESGEERDMLEAEIEVKKDGVVKYTADGIILDTKLVEVGVPQVFRLVDKYMAVVKHEDGNMDFYYIPGPDEEEVVE